MKIKLLGLTLIGALFAGIVTYLLNPINPIHFTDRSSNSAYAQNTGDEEAVRVYQQVSKAVVSVATDNNKGSGSIISPDGLVLTNAHVVRNTGTATITLADGDRLPADVIGYGDNGLDLAMVKIQGHNNLPTVPIAAVGSALVGQRVLAIGNPFGQFAGSLTTGIISRLDKNKGLIQTDAAINPGYSGGPLLNLKGELIGVNTAIFTRNSPEGSNGNIGISFAIAADQIHSFISAVREGRAPRTPQIAQTEGKSRHEEALAGFDRAIKIDPNDYLAWNGRAMALGNLGRHEEALAAFDQALKLRPDFVEALNGRGMALGNLGRHEEALAAFDQVIKLRPDFIEAWNGRGIALGSLGQDREALDAFEEALKIRPNDPVARRNRDVALRKLRR